MCGANIIYHMMQHTSDNKALALKAQKICFTNLVCVILRLFLVSMRFNTAYKPRETYLVNVGLTKRIVKTVWRIYSSTAKNGMTAKVVGKISQGTTFTQKPQTHLGSLHKATALHQTYDINDKSLIGGEFERFSEFYRAIAA